MKRLHTNGRNPPQRQEEVCLPVGVPPPEAARNGGSPKHVVHYGILWMAFSGLV